MQSNEGSSALKDGSVEKDESALETVDLDVVDEDAKALEPSSDVVESQRLLDIKPEVKGNEKSESTKSSSSDSVLSHVGYLAYVIVFTSIWFVSDPGYTLYAKFSFKIGQTIWPSPLIPLAAVLWWQFVCSSLLGLLTSIPLLPQRAKDLRECIVPSRATWIMIGLNGGAQTMQMAALAWGSLSLSQVLRAMEPIFLLFWFWLSKTPVDAVLYVSTIPIYAGAILAAGSSHHLSWISLLTGTLSNLLLTGRNFFLKLAMSDEREQPVPVLLAQTSVIPALVATCVLLCLQLTGIPIVATVFQKQAIFSGMLFAIMRVSSVLMLKEFSLLAHSLLKLSRRVVVIVAAFVIYHTAVDAIHVCGICMTLLGALCAELVKRFQSWKVLIFGFIACFGFSGLAFVVTDILIKRYGSMF